MTHDELNLVNLARQGDRAAYGRLVGAYQGLVFAVALNVTGHWGDSEDAVQEAFLRAWLALRSLADPARFAAWLCAIARNAALEILRRNRRLPLAALDESPAREIPSNVETPSEAYARRQLAGILWTEVAELPARTREAILLFYVEEYSIRRAAEFLGISEAAFKMRLQYGRERLREALSKKLAEELNRRKPGESRRQAIITALPMLPGLLGSLGTGGGGGLAGLLAAWGGKQVAVMIGAALLAGAALTGAILHTLHSKKAQLPPFEINATKNRAVAAALAPPAAVAPTTATLARTAPPPATPTPTPAGSFPVRGRLLFFETGAALPDLLPVLDDGWPTEQRARATPRGGWELASVPAGRHTLHFRDEDCADRFIHPAGGILLDLWIEQPVEDLRVYVHPPTGVSGQVLDQDGRPITGALVAPYNLREKPETHVLSDAQGNYRITSPHYEPGLLRYVHCEAPGYFAAESMDISAYYGHVTQGLDIRLLSRSRSGSVSGRIVNRHGRPVPLLPLSLHPVNDGRKKTDRIPFQADLMTDAEGRFQAGGVPSGTVKIAVEPISVGPRLKEKEVEVPPGGKVEGIEIQVDRELGAGAISGRLVKRDGSPAPGEILYAARPVPVRTEIAPLWSNSSTWPGQESGPRGGLSSTRTAPDGSFLIPGLTPGERVDLVLDDHNLRWSEWPVTVMRGLRVPMRGLQVLYPADPYKPRQSPQPTPGVHPDRLFAALGWEELNTPGSMMYNALALASAPCLGTSRFGDTRMGDSYWRSQTILEGRVVDASDNPIAGVEITFNKGQGRDRTRSNAQGEFMLRRMISETILTVIPPEGYREASLPPALPPPQRPGDDKVIRNLKIVLERGDPRRLGSITGAVLDARGTPFGDLSVQLTPVTTHENENRPHTYAHTDKEGLFAFENVPSGSYELRAGNDLKNVTVQEGKASAVILLGTGKKQ